MKLINSRILCGMAPIILLLVRKVGSAWFHRSGVSPSCREKVIRWRSLTTIARIERYIISGYVFHSHPTASRDPPILLVQGPLVGYQTLYHHGYKTWLKVIGNSVRYMKILTMIDHANSYVFGLRRRKHLTTGWISW